MDSIKKNSLDYLFLLLLLIASMWQVSFLQATMKWDIIDITLPWNYYITECLQNGELPFWNPFCNGGFAQMGINDTWNPITWLVGSIWGYDPLVIQLQYLGHLYLGGLGFYHLGKYLGWSRSTQLVMASAFMLSGFMIGNAQHLGWIIGASWLPWVFLSFKKWKSEPSLYRSVALAILVAFMFLGSYPGIFIGTVYILLCVFIFRVIRLWRLGDFSFLKKTISSAFISGGVFIALTLVALVGMLRLSEYINRGESLPLEAALSGSLPWKSITTFLFPSSAASHSVMWGTDWTLVNCYFGLIPFLFLIFSFSKKNLLQKTKWYWFGVVFFFAMAMGNDLPLRSWLHSILPLLDIFRLPTYFRIFGIFFLLLASGFSLDYFFQQKNKQYTYKVILVAAVMILGLALWSKSYAGLDGGTLVERKGTWDFLPETKFYNNISTQGLIHFVLLLMLSVSLIFFKKKKLQQAVLLGIVALDMFFAVQLNMEATVIHPISPKEVNSAFHYYSPKKYPLPPIDHSFQSLHRVSNFDYVHLHVNLNHFHKLPSPDGASPVYFKWVAAAMKKGIYQKTIQNPLVFGVSEISEDGIITDASIDSLSFEKIKVKKFTPNEIEVETNFSQQMNLVYLQNFHPDWKVYVNDLSQKITRCNEAFLVTKISGGKQKIRFVFEPKVEKIAFYISLGAWIMVGLFFITLLRKRVGITFTKRKAMIS